MQLSMVEIDTGGRQPFALAEEAVYARLRGWEGIEGCVVLSTRDRAELYLSCGDGFAQRPFAVLCAALGLAPAAFEGSYVERDSDETLDHLCALACGAGGGEQILAQIGRALKTARECRAADPVLETLFRAAIACAQSGEAAQSPNRRAAVVGEGLAECPQAQGTPVTGDGERERKKTHFPLFLDIRGQRALVVGGGEIATRRVETLRRFALSVTVVAEMASDALRCLAEKGEISLCERRFAQADLDGALLVVAATGDRALNREIGLRAKARGLFVSVADCAGECNFYFPAVVEQGRITAAVTGDGSDHRAVARAAKQIRALWDGGGNL